MFGAILAKIFGTKNERELKKLCPLVVAVNELEPAMRRLSDAELAAKTGEFKQRLAQGASLDDLLVEAFAVVREVARRTLNMRHFDVQLIGGIVLHQGKIAEMKTGEGKTLVATLPVYLNALEGKGVHVVTVNDYLAKRDAEWMGQIYKFLGLSVGVIVHDLDDDERRQAYACDVTYGTNNEFGFDYLRDNMKFRLQDCVQRGHRYAIVDEVDSILIDEARTPLIISGPSEESTDKYYKINRIIPKLVRGEVIKGKEPGETYTTGDYTVDEKNRTVALTEEGVLKVEKLLGIGNLYDPANIEINHHVQQALRAHVLFHRDKDYVVKDGQVIIVDEFTGRLMPGRRWSDGLHQAIEAKEGVKIERENQTLATITFQNYFRMYKKLAGMTGTAETEAAEFEKIYKLEVVVIPTNRPVQRIHHKDLVYLTKAQKFQAAVALAVERSNRGQPVLVGCGSVRDAEVLDRMFTKAGIAHETLTAKFIEREAHIIANAGLPGAITIATNMAGRGTDIVLGGEKPESADEAALQAWRQRHEQVRKAGGLFVLGTERSGIRRIDNQLAGRAGRQGDPGEVQFLLSLEDDLLKAFGRAKSLEMARAYLRASQGALGGSMVKKLIDSAQKSVESEGFAARKNLMLLDKVQAEQRDAIYALRQELLSKGAQHYAYHMVGEAIQNWLNSNMPQDSLPESWNALTLRKDIQNLFGVEVPLLRWSELYETDEIRQRVSKSLLEWADKRLDALGEQVTPLVLSVLDELWVEHLQALEELRQNFQFKTKTGFNPVFQYGKDAFELFTAFEKGLAAALAHRILVESLQSDTTDVAGTSTIQAAAPTPWVITPEQKVALALEKAWVRRNDPCPCESGKRFKECHGKLAR